MSSRIDDAGGNLSREVSIDRETAGAARAQFLRSTQVAGTLRSVAREATPTFSSCEDVGDGICRPLPRSAATRARARNRARVAHTPLNRPRHALPDAQSSAHGEQGRGDAREVPHLVYRTRKSFSGAPPGVERLVTPYLTASDLHVWSATGASPTIQRTDVSTTTYYVVNKTYNSVSRSSHALHLAGGTH